MKITDLLVTPVAFPDPPLRNANGVHEPYAIRHILQIRTDDGLTGISETYGGETMKRKLDAARKAIRGHNPRHVEVLRNLVRDPRARSAIEVACLDLCGKSTGLSVSELLGGPVRDTVEFSAYLFFRYEDERDGSGRVMDPAAMLDEARQFWKSGGFRCFKLKAGVLPPDTEIECLKLLRERFSDDHPIRIDPNGAWSVQTAIRMGKPLADLNIEYLEDPCSGIAEMAEVRQHVTVPLSTNSCIVQWEHIPDAVDLGPVDVILSDPHYWGGLTATKYLGHLCEVLGFGVGMHSNSHLGISMATMIHAAAVTPQITYACDTHYPWLREDVLQGGMFQFRDGRVAVPAQPGLGVEIDPDRLQSFHENYIRCGQKERDDQARIRDYEPDWVYKFPRW